MAALTYIAVAQTYEWGAPGEFQASDEARAVASAPRAGETIARSSMFFFGSCPEGGAESAIVENNGFFELVRAHCSDLENSERLDNFKIDLIGKTLKFNGQVFTRE